MTSLAPIALFVYNRPEHTRRTVEHLLKNPEAAETDLHIFADGPKTPNAPGVQEIREYIRTISGFRSIAIYEQNQNLGLVKSTIFGMDAICRRDGKVIMVEDDLCVSPNFLGFLNAGLDLYENDDEVISINGYTYPIEVADDEGLPATFFMKGADCWGFATWRRGWDLFEADGAKLLAEIKARNLSWAFDRQGSFPYTRMLEDHVNGKIDSWSIRWYAAAFLKDKLTLYPRRSLVQNIGHDGSGTNCGSSSTYDVALEDKMTTLERIPTQENPVFVRKVADFFVKSRQPRTVTLEEALALARQHLDAGDANQAKAICEMILRQFPENAAAGAMLNEMDPEKKIKGAYKKSDYVVQSQISSVSAQRIVPFILQWINPASVLDIGCGAGTFLQCFQNHGVSDVLGVDGSDIGRDQFLIDFNQFRRIDLRRSFDLGRSYSLVISLEVAEHIPAEHADEFIENICRHGSVVLFSAAVPFQGGEGHVNEQWPSYWAQKFAKFGYRPFDALRKKIWKTPDIAFWYRQNCMIYANNQGLAANPNLAQFDASADIDGLDIVHPDLFMEKALNYSGVLMEKLSSIGGHFEFRKESSGKISIHQVKLP